MPWHDIPGDAFAQYRARADAQMAQAEAIAAEVLRNAPYASHEGPAPAHSQEVTQVDQARAEATDAAGALPFAP